MDEAIYGHIYGLLEAWCDTTRHVSWRDRVMLLDDQKKGRLIQLASLLHVAFVVRHAEDSVMLALVDLEDENSRELEKRYAN